MWRIFKRYDSYSESILEAEVGSFRTHSKISRVPTPKARELVANAQLIATVNYFKLNGGFYLITNFWRRINMGS